MSARPKVSILVVSYNTKDITLAAIRSVYKHVERVSYEVIVVDNASSDGSDDAIAAEFPQCTLIRSEDNVGFGRANNLAALSATGEYVLLLNPDTELLDDAIADVVEFAERRPEGGIWGGRTVFKDGSLNPYSCWRYMSLWSLTCGALGLSRMFSNSDFFNAEAYGGWQRGEEREVDIVTGCFLLLKRELWNKLGGFDPTFFMYAEEADLCYRAHLMGARPMISPEATLIHLGAVSDRAFGPKVVRLWKGKMTFARKHWSGPRIFMAKTIYRAHAIGRITLLSILAPLTGRQRFKDTLEAWKFIWSRQSEWAPGYAPKPHGPIVEDGASSDSAPAEAVRHS